MSAVTDISYLIERELEQVRGNKELLHPGEVVDWAKRNPQSTLHRQFNWNDTDAANEYRLWQARRLIALHVIAPSGERKMVSLSIDRVKGGGYRTVDDAVRVKTLRDTMLKDALAELRRVRDRYQSVKELAAVFDAIDRADQRYSPASAA